MLFARICNDKAGHLDVRMDTRPDHVAYLNELNGKGVLKIAGPFLDHDGKPKPGHADGIALKAKYTLIGEGARDALAQQLKNGDIDGVLLMSPRTARAFARLIQRYGLVTEAKGLVCYCLSKAIAEAVVPLGVEARVPPYAREEDLIALVESAA